MAWTQTDVDRLKSAIATGALRVKYGSGFDEREVIYRSLDEMKATLAMMEQEVAGTTRTRVVIAEHRR